MISFFFRKLHLLFFQINQFFGSIGFLSWRTFPYLLKIEEEIEENEIEFEEQYNFLEILPDDVLVSIFGEWISDISDIVAFDSAMCNRSFRPSRYEKCLQYMVNPTIEIRSLKSLEKSMKWQELRKVSFKQKLILQGTDDSCLTAELNHIPSPSHTLSKDICRLPHAEFKTIVAFLHYLQPVMTSYHSILLSNPLHRSISYSFPELQSLTLYRRAISDGDAFINWILLYCKRLHTIELEACPGIVPANMIRLIQQHPTLHTVTCMIAWSVQTRSSMDVSHIMQQDISKKNANIRSLSLLSHDGFDLLEIAGYCPVLKHVELAIGTMLNGRFSFDTFVHCEELMIGLCSQLLPSWVKTLTSFEMNMKAIPPMLMETLGTMYQDKLTMLQLTCDPAVEPYQPLFDLSRYQHIPLLFSSLHTLIIQGTAPMISALYQCILQTKIETLQNVTIQHSHRLSGYRKLFQLYGSQLTSLTISVNELIAPTTWKEIFLYSSLFAQLHTLNFEFAYVHQMYLLVEMMSYRKPLLPTVKYLTLGKMIISMENCIQLIDCFPNLISVWFKDLQLSKLGFALTKTYHLQGSEQIQECINKKDLNPYEC